MTDFNEHLDDGSLHRHGDLARTCTAASATAGSALRLRSLRCTTRNDSSLFGNPHRNIETLAVDFDSGVATYERFGIFARCCWCNIFNSGKIENFFNPLSRVLEGSKVGVLQNCQVGGDGGVDTFNNHLFKCTNGARDCRWAIFAPHDELANQVVVVLADLVATFVARVKAHTETIGRNKLGDLAW